MATRSKGPANVSGNRQGRSSGSSGLLSLPATLGKRSAHTSKAQSKKSRGDARGLTGDTDTDGNHPPPPAKRTDDSSGKNVAGRETAEARGGLSFSPGGTPLPEDDGEEDGSAINVRALWDSVAQRAKENEARRQHEEEGEEGEEEEEGERSRELEALERELREKEERERERRDEEARKETERLAREQEISDEALRQLQLREQEAEGERNGSGKPLGVRAQRRRDKALHGASFLRSTDMDFKRACGDAVRETCLVDAMYNALQMLGVEGVSLARLRNLAIPVTGDEVAASWNSTRAAVVTCNIQIETKLQHFSGPPMLKVLQKTTGVYIILFLVVTEDNWRFNHAVAFDAARGWLVDNHSKCTPLQLEPTDIVSKDSAKKAFLLLIGRQRGLRSVKFRLDMGPAYLVSVSE